MRELDKTVPRMLVVDDDPRNRRVIEGYLQAEGYALHSVGCGPDALAVLPEFQPDVVLLDVMMPGMNGYEVCERIKTDPRFRLCQVMLVTALDGTAKTVEGLDTGADDYVTKPVRREEFLAKVRALVRARALVLELEEAREELAHRNKELEIKKMLAQSLVHDLKNPLQAVLGNLDLVRRRIESRGHSDDDLSVRMDRARQSARRMHRMVQDILDVEALESGNLDLPSTAVDLVQIARDAIDDYRAAASIVSVDIELDASGQVWVAAEGAMLRRVVDNLISNAVAYSPRDSTIEVTAMPDPSGAALTVRDFGRGIPEDKLELIFDKWARLEESHSERGSGSGLGLTFCRLAVGAFGGVIVAENAPGGGACFRVILPDAEAAEPTPPRTAVG